MAATYLVVETTGISMSMRSGQRRVGLWSGLVASALVAAVIAAGTSPAEARHHRHSGVQHTGRVRHVFHIRTVRREHGRLHGRSHLHAHHLSAGTGGFLAPTYSSIIVDANTGRTLSAENENAPHHPASVTKVMTLYLLFEQLEKGRLSLDSDLTISPHAAAQAPSKLGLRPGSTIEVEDAIKAVVTKSANDIACAIAENIAGDEPSFADLMTRRARSLGMLGTTYKNASGLPNPQQITTARDLSILGRAIQDRFPRYYKYFATRTFYFAGRPIPNHNHLLGRVEGMDGIKTGYTAASGFNLLTSVRRDGRHIVGVVLGGRSAPQRDHIMAGLIEDNMMDGATHRTAMAIAEQDTESARESARVMEASPDGDETEAKPARAPAATMAAAPVAAEPVLRAEPRRINERRVAMASLDLSVPVPQSAKARPAVVTATRAVPETTESIGRASRPLASDGSTARAMAYAPTATPSSLRWIEGAPAEPTLGGESA